MSKRYSEEEISKMDLNLKIALSKKKIEKVLVNWFNEDPIMLGVFCLVDKRPDKNQKSLGINTKIHPAAVTYNPNFILSVSEERLECVLAQEGFKLLLRHPSTRLSKPRNIAGLASSVTVTPMSLGPLLNMEGMEDFFPTPEKFGMPNDKYFEDYFRRLMDQQEATQEQIQEIWNSMSDEDKQDAMDNASQPSQGDSGQEPGEAGQGQSSGQGQDGDGFEQFGGGDEAMKEYFDPNGTNTVDWGENELFDSDVKNMIDEKKSSAKDWGKFTGDAMGDIIAANTPKISWKEVIRRFARSVLSTRTFSSRMKTNRRHDLVLPGQRREYDTKIIFAIDVSGSMSDDDLKEGFAVINSTAKHADITYIQFDTEIKKVEKDFKKAKQSFSVLGRGGTDFQCIVDYAKEHKHDGIVIFTDGYACSPTKPKAKVLWLLHEESQTPPVEWGGVAYLNRFSGN